MPSNNLFECTSKHPSGSNPTPRAIDLPDRSPSVPAASGFSTTCHTSPAASITTPSTGTTNFAPLRATASTIPTSPATNAVRSSAICQRCFPATRDSSRISVTTPKKSFTRPPSFPSFPSPNPQTVASRRHSHKEIPGNSSLVSITAPPPQGAHRRLLPFGIGEGIGEWRTIILEDEIRPRGRHSTFRCPDISLLLQIATNPPEELQ